jgi:hypothetical protein
MLSYIEACAVEALGDDVVETRAETIFAAATRIWQASVASGELRTRCHDVDAAVRGALDAANAGATASLQSLRVERGSLHAWLVQTNVEALSGGVVQVKPGTAVLIRPLQAVGLLTGDGVSQSQLHARYARHAHVRGWLDDHASGRGPLPPAALANARAIEHECDTREDAFAAACAELLALIGEKPGTAFGRTGDGNVRPLSPEVFTDDIALDVVTGRCTPSAALMIGSVEREHARAACSAIGQVFVRAASINGKRGGRRAGTAASEHLARRLLIGRLQDWFDLGGHICDAPKRSEWLHSEGPHIAGSAAAARRAWASAVASDVAFAPLRQRGRRPNRSVEMD